MADGDTRHVAALDKGAAAPPKPPAEPASAKSGATEPRAKLRDLSQAQMPRDFSISLDAYRRGGTDAFLGQTSAPRLRQSMKGFEPTYVDIVDYIVRITHRIWEEKDIGYIYDTYSQDCAVWDDHGLQYGRDKIVADTIQLQNGFPDIRVVADEVIWAGDDEVGFHTSHRTRIFGVNCGFTHYGPPTGRRVQFWCLANCVARDNEIFEEHVVYDTAGLIQQLGYDVVETARRFASLSDGQALLPENFAGSEGKRLEGQRKPVAETLLLKAAEDPDAFARIALNAIWNRRNLAAVGLLYSPSIVSQVTAGRLYQGVGQVQSFILSMLAMFTDLTFFIDDLYWMGSEAQGLLIAIRWSFVGRHTGPGRYGTPTGREVTAWGITHWVVDKDRVQKEWFMFNEFGLLMQLHRSS